MEDYLGGRRSQQNTTSMDDGFNGRKHQCKTMEDDLSWRTGGNFYIFYILFVGINTLRKKIS